MNMVSFYSLFVILSPVFLVSNDLGVIIVVAAIRWNSRIIFQRAVQALYVNTF